MSTVNDGVRAERAADQFEWWYFDFPTDDGGVARLEWHAPLFNLRDHNCVLVLRHYESHRAAPTVSAAAYPRSRVEMSDDCCDIRFPSGQIVEEGGDYRIRIREQAFELDLHLTRQLPPVSHPDGEIISAAGGKEHFCWSIPLPRALAEGHLLLGGQTRAVNGLGYHDHNWGNLHFQQRLRRWIWLRAPFDDLTLIFAQIELRDVPDPMHQLIVLDREGRMVETPNLEVDLDGEQTSDCSRLTIPATINIGFGTEQDCGIRIETAEIHSVEEEPLGIFASHRLNAFHSRLWYAAGLRRLPQGLRTMAGRLLFLQATARVELVIDHRSPQQGPGLLEVFYCDR